mgnify:CR=1 FL=1
MLTGAPSLFPACMQYLGRKYDLYSDEPLEAYKYVLCSMPLSVGVHIYVCVCVCAVVVAQIRQFELCVHVWSTGLPDPLTDGVFD